MSLVANMNNRYSLKLNNDHDHGMGTEYYIIDAMYPSQPIKIDECLHP